MIKVMARQNNRNVHYLREKKYRERRVKAIQAFILEEDSVISESSSTLIHSEPISQTMKPFNMKEALSKSFVSFDNLSDEDKEIFSTNEKIFALERILLFKESIEFVLKTSIPRQVQFLESIGAPDKLEDEDMLRQKLKELKNKLYTPTL